MKTLSWIICSKVKTDQEMELMKIVSTVMLPKALVFWMNVKHLRLSDCIKFQELESRSGCSENCTQSQVPQKYAQSSAQLQTEMSLEVFLSTIFWLYGGTPKEATQLGRGGLDDRRPTSQVEFLLR